MNIMFIADIVGEQGIDVCFAHIQEVKAQFDVHVVIANGENSAGGKGLTPQLTFRLFDMGIDVITSGNHIWNKSKILNLLNEQPNLLRPANYPPGTPGHGSVKLQVNDRETLGVLNLQGRSFMYPIDCPFRTADAEIQNLKSQGISLIFVDIHAEATAEKMALAWHLDGKVSAVIGSHTHVQTADERILTKGTAYITDAGMSGSFHSVIGMDKDVAIKRFMTQMPVYYKLGTGDPRFCGVIVGIDRDSGKAVNIQRFEIPD
ncbi:metallophosphoesterase [bacterium I07]|nr:metallophosphoesterase [bacterium I07]